MPLCLYSEPVRWLRMLRRTRRRYRQSEQRPASFYVPHLSGAPFRDSDPTARVLEEHFPAISAEFARVAAEQEVITPSHALVASGRWSTFPLMRAGKPLAENTARCPDTWSAAQACPLPEGMRGGVYFSIIYPQTHVRPHYGPSNLKIRYHLAIEEAEGVRIRSGREWRTWRLGRCLILDDSFEHEVVHSGDARRVVLIVDCWHPDLTPREREFLAQLHRIWRRG